MQVVILGGLLISIFVDIGVFILAVIGLILAIICACNNKDLEKTKK
mgnify:CR=1 FL=1